MEKREKEELFDMGGGGGSEVRQRRSAAAPQHQLISSSVISYRVIQGRPKPPKPVMHIHHHIFRRFIISPYFRKIYKFLPISAKCIHRPPIFVQVTFLLLLNLRFLLPPILTMMHFCFTRAGRP